jgi:hypothetical protein
VFARRETALVLGKLASEFDVKYVGAKVLSFDLGLTMRPASPVLVTLKPRPKVAPVAVSSSTEPAWVVGSS